MLVRILRKQHEIRPLIIDIKDNFRPFLNQYNKRKAFYKKCKYQIEEIKIENNTYKKTLEEKYQHNIEISNIIDDNDKDIIKKSKNKKQIHLEECIMSDDD